MIFQDPAQLAWLSLLLPLFLLIRYGQRQRQRALEKLNKRSTIGLPSRRKDLRWLALPTALLFLVLALARPSWNPKQEQLSRESRDVVFVLDVSKSMLAEDRTPNRLENAKTTILSCVEKLDPGQRIGLVVFAGTSSIKCPLTTDHRFFANALSDVAPWSVTHGGTRIGDALLKTCEKLLSNEMRGFQDVILITDGGNQEESYTDALTALNELEASLIAIGVGSANTGSRIPVEDSDGARFMLHDGQEVWTKLDTTTLEEMVAQSVRGLLLKAGTRSIDLADIYIQFSAHTEKRSVMVDVIERYEEGFPWMLGLTLIGLLIGAWPRKAVILLTAAVSLSLGIENTSATPAFQKAHTQYRNGDYEGALWGYEAIANHSHDSALQIACFYNMGNSAFMMPDMVVDEEDDLPEEEILPPSYWYEMAIKYYRAVLDLDPHHARAAHNLELARRKLKAAEDGDSEANNQPSLEDGEQSQEQEGESGPSDGSEEGESEEGDEYEEDFDSDADMSEQSRSTSNMTDLKNQDIPPPAVTPEQLLQEEQVNNAQREKGRGKKSKPVERDW